MKGREVYNLGTFFSLYIAQSIPMSFFSTVLPIMMRQENFSLTSIGLLQLIKLPWIFKFLWAPSVDRNCTSIADYKRWIFSSELIYAGIICYISFLNFAVNFHLILVLMILSFVASATQDIATDALAVVSFSKKDKSLLNSMQSMGSFGGSVIGGGLLVVLFHQLGWDTILFCLSLFVVLALIPLLFNTNLKIDPPEVKVKAKRADMFYFFSQKHIWKQIGFLFLVYSGLIGILAMIKPYMVDLGYDKKDIGFMNLIVGSFIGFLSSFAGGFIVRRLGKYHSRILFAFCIILTTLYFMLLPSMNPTTEKLYLGIGLLWGSYGMATIVVYTTAMDCVRPGREGTDFTVQTVITHLSGICIAVLSGIIADKIHYQGLFCFEFLLALLSLAYILIIFKKPKEAES